MVLSFLFEGKKSMIRKTIIVEFASPRIRAIECMTDLINAVKHAQRNLYYRHNINISEPYAINGTVYINMEIPEEICEAFTYGRHLRGISKYLLENIGGYKKYLVGTRLLLYVEGGNKA